ncbi:MAG: glycosyltransferase, partial [Acidimicrobiales bacterium]
MRVWHVNLTWCGPRVDGIAVAVERLAAAQSAAGADVQVFCPMLDHRSRRCAIRTIGRELRRSASRPDVVHFHSLFRLLHTGLGPVLRRLGVPYVVSPHSAAAPAGLARRGILKRAYTGVVERRFLRRAAAVLCLTEAERVDVGRFAPLPPDSAVVVPNPVDAVDGIVWEPPRPPARPRVVTLSRFDVHQKGLDRLCAIARRAPDVDFVVHGEVDKNAPARAGQLERAAPPNLSLRPPVFGSDKDEALRRSTLFILPSRWEG